MNVAKKSQTVQRILFNRSLDSFIEKCGNNDVSMANRHLALLILESRYIELERANNKCVEMSLESEATESDIVAEIETHEVYKLKFLEAKSKLLNSSSVNVPEAQGVVQGVVQNDKPLKRPILEIPKFASSINNWFKFWSDFKNIHEDNAIADEDKLEYLKQAMKVGSLAESIVDSFPTTAENYMKAFGCLKNRFGRDDLLVDLYTRRLLCLIVMNAMDRGKNVELSCPYTDIWDRLHPLETLGLTTNVCAPMLYPLVEYSLPDEIKQKWDHSKTICGLGTEEENITERLSRLLKFLKIGVENEKTHNQCIFCNDNHENAACEKAKTFSNTLIKSFIDKNSCCLKCLKIGHIAEKCEGKLKCSICSEQHSALTCWAHPRVGRPGGRVKIYSL